MFKKIIKTIMALVFTFTFTVNGTVASARSASSGHTNQNAAERKPTLSDSTRVVSVEPDSDLLGVSALGIVFPETSADIANSVWARNVWNALFPLPNGSSLAMTIGEGGNADHVNDSTIVHSEEDLYIFKINAGMNPVESSSLSESMGSERSGNDRGGSNACVEVLGNHPICNQINNEMTSLGIKTSGNLNPHGFPELSESLERVTQQVFAIHGNVNAVKELIDQNYPNLKYAHPTKASVAGLPDDPKVKNTSGGWMMDPVTGKPYMEALRDYNIYSTASGNSYNYWNGTTPAPLPDDNSRKVIALMDTGIECTDPEIFEHFHVNQVELPAAFKVSADADGNGYVSVNEILSATAAVNPQVLLANQGMYPQLFDGIDAAEYVSGVGNGIVDDIVGANYVTSAVPGNNPCNDPADLTPPTHATRAAGIIIASIDNQNSIAGIAANVGRIYPIKVVADDGIGSSLDFVNALNRIYFMPSVYGVYSAVNYPVDLAGILVSALNIFKDSFALPGMGSERVVIAPAGNTGIPELDTMSGLPTVLGVSGITKDAAGNDMFWGQSSRVPGVDVAGYVKQYSTEPFGNTDYGSLGTSWAAATVAGLFLTVSAYVEQEEVLQGKNTLWRAPHFHILASLTSKPLPSSGFLPNDNEGWGAVKIDNLFKGAKMWVDQWDNISLGSNERDNALKSSLAVNHTSGPQAGHLIIDSTVLTLLHPAQAQQALPIVVTCHYVNHPVLGTMDLPCGASAVAFSTPHRLVTTHFQTDINVNSTLSGFVPDEISFGINVPGTGQIFPEFYTGNNVMRVPVL